VTPQNSEKLFCFDDSSELVESLLNAGTIFLDEISYLDPDVQSRLLHILPDGGPAIADHGLQARIISSTAQSLQEEIRQGHFRKDLYYRLNGVCLRVPPLRGRREDIPLLVEFLLIKYAAVLNRPKPSLTTQALEKLVRYHWPGNVRQLEYAMKAVVALGDGDQALQELDENEFGFEEGEPQELSLKQTARAASRRAEREMILKALERTRWNRRKAARQLRISYRALLYKLKQIGSDGVLCQSDYHGERS
jgi:DNA-binding NtrC family response regulator